MARYEIVGRDESHRLTAQELLGMLEDCDGETSWAVGEITHRTTKCSGCLQEFECHCDENTSDETPCECTHHADGGCLSKMKTEQEVRERLAALQAALKSGHHHTIDTEHRLIAGCRTLRWVLGELKDDWS